MDQSFPNTEHLKGKTLINELFLNGKDSIQFMFSANKGSDPQEIYKVASGGELSRLLLCCSYLLSKYDDLPCIIFDEIDTGVSGEIAYLMSDMMKSMSNEKQIISIGIRFFELPSLLWICFKCISCV